jgi:hypothetical protein
LAVVPGGRTLAVAWEPRYYRTCSPARWHWGLLVHAESDEARDFYLHLVPEFEQSPTDDLHLVLLMKDIQRSLLQ